MHFERSLRLENFKINAVHIPFVVSLNMGDDSLDRIIKDLTHNPLKNTSFSENLHVRGICERTSLHIYTRRHPGWWRQNNNKQLNLTSIFLLCMFWNIRSWGQRSTCTVWHGPPGVLQTHKVRRTSALWMPGKTGGVDGIPVRVIKEPSSFHRYSQTFVPGHWDRLTSDWHLFEWV